MRVSGVVSAWAVVCVLVGGAGVDAAPCCVGAAVVGGLAFAGGVAVAKHKHHHHHHHHHHRHHGRRRRDVPTFLQDAEVQLAYQQVAAEDKDQCGLRLVCELAQQDPLDLAPDESQILLPYEGAGPSDGSIYGDYDEAAWHGQEGHSCPDQYPLCTFTARQVMDEYRKYVMNNGTFNVR